jgi:hypothetical protein
MTDHVSAERLSQYFSSFRKSEQIIVYDVATKNVGLLIEAVAVHLDGVASGRIFETYQIDRLGEWVGWCFPNHTEQLDAIIVKAVKRTAKQTKRAEVYASFNKGLVFGRHKARVAISNGGPTGPTKVRSEVVYPD